MRTRPGRIEGQLFVDGGNSLSGGTCLRCPDGKKIPGFASRSGLESISAYFSIVPVTVDWCSAGFFKDHMCGESVSPHGTTAS